jgi:amidase
MKQTLTALPLVALSAFLAGCQRPESSARAAAAHQVHEFTPTVFYNEFSPLTPPVLRIEPGDTVRTTTIDAAGSDDKGVSRGKAGNPQTGPFYVIGAASGDTVVVHLMRLD